LNEEYKENKEKFIKMNYTKKEKEKERINRINIKFRIIFSVLVVVFVEI
jgi:hypothetical protein